MRWFRTRPVYVPSAASICEAVTLGMLIQAIEIIVADLNEEEAERSRWDYEGGALPVDPEPPQATDIGVAAALACAFL